MKTWKIDDAQTHFREMLHFCHQEPQLVAEQDEPLAVVVDIKLFRDLTEAHATEPRPTISQLLDELEAIKMVEPVDIDIPEREDRFVAVS
jgi:hypothetical protein